MAETPAVAEPSFREQVETAEATQAPPEPAQEPAQHAEPAAEGGEPTTEKVERVVPLAALHEERENRKQLQRQLREYQQRQEQLQNQQVEMLRYMQSLQPQPKGPDPAADPLGANLHEVGALRQDVQAMRQDQQRQLQEQQQHQQFQAFAQAVDRMEASFAQTKPDYLEAVNWAKERKAAEYQILGMDEVSARQRVNHEAVQIAQVAMQRGESPAAVAYRLAETMGYQPKAKTVTPEQKLAMQKEGQSAAMPAAGGPGNGRLSLDALAKLSGDDFRKATEGSKWKQLMSKY